MRLEPALDRFMHISDVSLRLSVLHMDSGGVLTTGVGCIVVFL